MSTSFYARYIPSSRSKNASASQPERRETADHGQASQKRRKSRVEEPKPRKKRRTREDPAKTSGEEFVSSHRSQPENESVVDSLKLKRNGVEHRRKETHMGRSATQNKSKIKYEHDQDDDSDVRAVVDACENQGDVPRGILKQPRAKSELVQSDDTAAQNNKTSNAELDNDLNEEQVPKRKKKRKEKAPSPDAEGDNAELNAYQQRHAKLFDKYSKIAHSQKSTAEHEQNDSAQKQRLSPAPRSLEPIPQPPADTTYTSGSISSALPQWLRNPVIAATNSRISFNSLSVAPELCDQLQRSSLTHTLPIQSAVLPCLLPTIAQHPGDVCISASTGSGKTLSYILPIFQDLETLVRPLLRAVIVVPTRELVEQVQNVCTMLAASKELKVGTALGSKALQAEQAMFIGRELQWDPDGYRRYEDHLDKPAHASDESDESSAEEAEFDTSEAFNLFPMHTPAYRSTIDILITTPGRLVEHVKHTTGFSLSHLSWLVIDEADRLLDQSFQEWADIVNSALPARAPEVIKSSNDHPLPGLGPSLLDRGKVTPKKVVCSATLTRNLEKLALLHLENPLMVEEKRTHEQKRNDPRQNAQPNSANLPANLEEYALPVGDGGAKPLYLLKLLELLMSRKHVPGTLQKPMAPHRDKIDGGSNDSPKSNEDASSEIDSSSSSETDSQISSSDSEASSSSSLDSPDKNFELPRVLVFASTTESALRLSALLRHVSKKSIYPLTVTITKSSSAKTRQILQGFGSVGDKIGQKQQILISTDRASRGLDIENLSHVINYDVPGSVNDYIHRVGRTARAGQSGRSWTLLSNKEAAWFWHTIARSQENGNDWTEEGRIARNEKQKVRKVRLEDVKSEDRLATYENALAKLKGEVLGDVDG